MIRLYSGEYRVRETLEVHWMMHLHFDDFMSIVEGQREDRDRARGQLDA